MIRQKKIKQCTITLTQSCNLRCEFCYAKKTEYKNQFIEYKELIKIIDFCDECKMKYIVLSGGEPTLYPYLLDLVRYIKIKNNKLIPTIATNGIMLENYDYCKNLVESGIEYIDISLKGKDSSTFLDVTGCDHFQQQSIAISNLAKLKVNFTCSMVLTPKNIDFFCEAIQKAYDCGARNFSFTFVIDNNISTCKNEQYLEINNPFFLVNSFISKMEELNKITSEWWIEYSFPLCVYTNEQLVLLKNRLAAPCQVHKRNGITFDAQKNLLPCPMNINRKMGKFGIDFKNYKELKKYLNKNKSYNIFTKKLSDLPSEDCKACKHLKYCLGGCPFSWGNCSFNSFKEFGKRFLENKK